MDVRWQDEVKRLSEWWYKPEKEKWEQNTHNILGSQHWSYYLSEYSKLKREEICRGNSAPIVNGRMKRLHPTVWSLAMDLYNREKNLS